jgi:hypothetical protein
MLKNRTVWFILGLLSVSLLLTACGPSAAQLAARDSARSAALAAEAMADNLADDLANLPGEIVEKEAQVTALEAELAELQAEYFSLGGTR